MKVSLQEFLADPSTGSNLWPTPKEEAWKYFDFKKLKSFANLEVEQHESFNYQIEVLSSASSEVVISSDRVGVSKDLIDLGVKVEQELEFKLLNPQSKMDRRFYNLNQIRPTIVLKFESFKEGQTVAVKFNLQESASDVVGATVRYEVKNSNLAVYESYDASAFKAQAFSSVITQVHVLDSDFKQFVVQEALPASQALLYSSEAELRGASHYKLFLTTLNTQFVRNQNNVHILSEGAQAEVLTFALAGEAAFSESRTEIAHYKEGGVSRQLFKAIVSDQAKAIFNGRIYIDPEAQKTDSAQSCKGLLLGEQAQINAKPELEIYADDVKAAHGAAIGQVSKDELFYLLSRGISPENAYDLLAQAFAGEVIQGIPDRQLRKEISVKIKDASAPIFADLIQSYKLQSAISKDV